MGAGISVRDFDAAGVNPATYYYVGRLAGEAVARGADPARFAQDALARHGGRITDEQMAWCLARVDRLPPAGQLRLPV